MTGTTPGRHHPDQGYRHRRRGARTEQDQHRPPTAVEGGRRSQPEGDHHRGGEHRPAPVDEHGDGAGGEGDEVEERLVHR